MALYVNTNVSSINGRRNLTNATNNLNTTYQRLSSGLRINSAKDDAAGLQISDRLTSQINGLNQVKGFEQKFKSLNGVINVNMHTI